DVLRRERQRARGFLSNDERHRRACFDRPRGTPSTSFQNSFSPITVTACPFAAIRRTSINLVPPARPATCNALGRPRTSTCVASVGLLCTVAPALRAAAIASARGRLRNPVNDTRFPLRSITRPSVGALG